MVTEERNRSRDSSGELGAILTPSSSDDLASPEDLGLDAKAEAVVPPGISVAESQEFQAKAAKAVKQLEEASGGKKMELVDSITAVGVQAQRHAGRDLELLRARVGDMMTRGGPGEKISQDLLDLRLALDQINPHELNRSWFRSVVSTLPIINRFHPLVTRLKKIAIRYETVSKQVRVVESSLQDGRMLLTRDNIELRMLYEQVEAQQLVILKNGYLGELLMQKLEEALERSDASPKAARLREALSDVATRVQDLKAMVEVHIMLFVSIEMTRQNNTRLGQSVDRTLTLATNTVTIGLALQSALARQKRVLEAVQRTREFIGDLLAANAASIRQHTAEIGDIYNSPVVAIEKLAQAHNDLVEAINLVEQLKTEGLDAARQNIDRLNEMAEELRQKLEGLGERRQTESLEA